MPPDLPRPLGPVPFHIYRDAVSAVSSFFQYAERSAPLNTVFAVFESNWAPPATLPAICPIACPTSARYKSFRALPGIRSPN